MTRSTALIALVMGSVLALSACSVEFGQGTVTTGGSGGTSGSVTSDLETEGGSASVSTSSCTTAPSPVQTGTGPLDATVQVNGAPRTYKVWLPSGYDGTRAVPLIVNYHGTGGTPEGQELFSGVAKEGNPRGYLVVAMQAEKGESTAIRWTVPGFGKTPDDLAFTNAVLDQVSSKYCVDAKRIYATGFSSGGAMTTYMACADSARFAAVSPGGGVNLINPANPTTCTHSPIPIYAFHGDADSFVPYTAAIVPSPSITTDTPFFGDVQKTVDYWANSNGCQPERVDQPLASDVTLRTYKGCTADTQLLIVKGGDHTWPGNTATKASVSPATQSVDMTKLMLDFFDQHSKA